MDVARSSLTPLETETERRRRFLRLLTFIMVSFTSAGMLLVIILQIVRPSPSNLITIGLMVVSILTGGSAYLLSRNERTLSAGIWIFVVFILALPDARLLTIGATLPSAALFIPSIIITMFLLPRSGLWISLPWALISISGFYLLQAIGYTSPGDDSNRDIGPVILAFNWCLVISLSAVLVAFLFKQLRVALRATAEQNSRLETSLDQIEHKRQLGEELGQRINGVSTELNATSIQQGTNSQRQATALTEVTSFVQEISSTAQSIAGKANQLNEAAAKIKLAVEAVEATASQVASAGMEGEEAVERTLSRNRQVTGQYEILKNLLAGLDQRQNQIRSVINLLKSIGDETHLLSLNAAIEAAGAGEYGDRFGIVAQEIKELAGRSLQSSNEVREKLSEIEAEIREAAHSAEEGYLQTVEALAEAQESGNALRKLVESIERNALEVNRIGASASTMRQETEEIRIATNQQSRASVQAADTLVEIEQLSRQTAGGSTEITRSAHFLETLSADLRDALTE